MKNFHKFYLFFFLTSFVILNIAAAVNFFIDPYHIFYSKHFGPRESRPEAHFHQRLVKARDLSVFKPQAIILGSSRVMEGIHTKHLERLTGLEWYNAGLAGANMKEMASYFSHALRMQPQMKKVLIGLDLFAFSANRRTRGDFKEWRLKKTLHYRDIISALWSKDALKASFRTLKTMNDPSKLVIDLKGNNPEHRVDSYMAHLGLTLTEFENSILKPYFKEKDYYGEFALSDESIKEFKLLVDECRKNGIEVQAFFCPCKVIYWHGLYQIGLWPTLEDLKRALVDTINIWDFSGCNEVTADEECKDIYYFDAAHFRPPIGERIASVIYGQQSEEEAFGIELTKENVEEHLLNLREKQTKWAHTNPQSYQRIINLQSKETK